MDSYYDSKRKLSAIYTRIDHLIRHNLRWNEELSLHISMSRNSDGTHRSLQRYGDRGDRFFRFDSIWSGTEHYGGFGSESWGGIDLDEVVQLLDHEGWHKSSAILPEVLKLMRILISARKTHNEELNLSIQTIHNSFIHQDNEEDWYILWRDENNRHHSVFRYNKKGDFYQTNSPLSDWLEDLKHPGWGLTWTR